MFSAKFFHVVPAQPSIRLSALATVMLAALCGAAAAQTSPGPFAQSQIASGRDQFTTNCVECHGKNLGGVSAPALAGKEFIAQWKDQTSADLYAFIRKTMPMCQGGVLGNGAYADIVA